MKTDLTTGKPDIIHNSDDGKAKRLHDWLVKNYNKKEDVYLGLRSEGIDTDNIGNNIQKKITLLITTEHKLMQNPEYSDTEMRKSVSQVGGDIVNYHAFYQQYLLRMVTQKQMGLAPDVLSADFDKDNNEDDWLTVFS